MDEKIQKLQEMIDESKNIVFFGGAGVSTESGIPDFRSQDGLYQQEWKYPPETIISRSFFDANPKEFYRFYRKKLIVKGVQPNVTHKKLAELGKPDILILDDFGMKQCDHLFSLDLLEVVEERYHKRKSVLIGAQMPVRLWPEFFKNKTAADGFMDRIVNNAYRIELKGPSRRPKMPDDEMWESCGTDASETTRPSSDGQSDLSGMAGKEGPDEAQPGY